MEMCYPLKLGADIAVIWEWGGQQEYHMYIFEVFILL